jgi:hypothetical protein
VCACVCVYKIQDKTMVVAPTNPPPPTSSAPNNGMLNIGIYSVISLVYLLIDYFSSSSSSSSSSSDKTDNTIKTPSSLTFIFTVIIWLVQFFITFLSLQQQCNTPNYWLAAWSSFATWFLLFVPIFWCLEYKPDWLQPFGNTFGYLFIKMNGAVSFMDSILKPKGDGKLQKYLDYMKEDPWALFSMLTTSTADPAVDASQKFDELNSEGYLISSLPADAKHTFVNYVRAKESVAKFVFYVLTLNLMADMTFIVAQENSPCAINIDELNDAAAATKAKAKAKKPTNAVVFKTSE